MTKSLVHVHLTVPLAFLLFSCWCPLLVHWYLIVLSENFQQQPGHTRPQNGPASGVHQSYDQCKPFVLIPSAIVKRYPKFDTHPRSVGPPIDHAGCTHPTLTNG